ncbi:uncharacterized protein C1orf87 homolog [Ochotona curzoniae]|uniref:uncharacterized protein C1orf87 homolog n=1 Tax=Ochotona curzoniae TaxID=130825 RepID=UPI001B34910B|nr:uncharacterized protein C1orf87 homolog [Ochotona curzoniae]
MSLPWKTPPGNSDTMPEIGVKIIGGKHFRYLVEKPDIKENENSKANSQESTQKLKTSTVKQVSGDEQTNYNPNDVEENTLSENNEKFRSVAHGSRFLDGKVSRWTNVHCSSVPTGDQSLSYLHDFPRRKLRNQSLEQMAVAGSEQPEDIDQKPSGITEEDTLLLAVVRRELKSHALSSSFLDKLQEELQILDPISSGCLLQSQLSHLFLRHKVPLQLPTVKILCQRFSRMCSPEMVDYRKLLCFLKDAISGDSLKSQSGADKNMRVVQSHSKHQQRLSPQDSSSPTEVNKDLVGILKMALRTANSKLNIENLNLSFRKEDRSFSGCLPPPKVRAICGKHGLYLTLSLLETLLAHQDLGYQDEIKWQKFLELLSRASSDLSSYLPTGKNEKESLATPVETEVPRTEHVKTSEEELQPENPPAETPTPKDAWSLWKIRPISQPSTNPAVGKEAEESETWINRFRKLENALYLCDLSNTGVLEKERARRLIHNYNLIYNLSLSPQKIDQALRRFRSGDNILLEPALRFLKEL